MPYRILLAFSCVAFAQPPASLEARFDSTVKPFVNKYCVGCHSGATPAAQFDIKSYNTLGSVVREFPRWALVMERLHAKDMPPKPMQPAPDAEVHPVVEWIQAVRAQEIKRFASDPGIVPARRLSNAEYNYSIRDLTGQDMQLTKEFPIDPANPAGFDNSGESLTMSPALLNKYLTAAREASSRVVFHPDRLEFAPHPMLVETDREKYAVQRIVNFYYSQPTKFAPYFEASWRFKHRAALGKPAATLASIAADMKLSAKYLPMVWQILNESNAAGPILKLQAMFRALPAPSAEKKDADKVLCQEMDDFVVRIRTNTGMQHPAPRVRGLPSLAQPLANWRNLQYALNRRKFEPKSIRTDADPKPEIKPVPRFPGLHTDAVPRWITIMENARAKDEDLVVPAAQRERYVKAFERFAEVFPDKFYVSERGRFFPDDSTDKGRLLSAGYHNVHGFYRDDVALQELILDDKAKAELDRLWNEFDFVGEYSARTWVQYFVNQSGAVLGKGAESGSPRPEGHEITDTFVIMGLKKQHLELAAKDSANDPQAETAIVRHFDGYDRTLRALEKQRIAAEPRHLDSLLQFAAKAYRRPLTAADRDGIVSYYKTLRSKNELSHENAVRESIVSILMAPDFLYRIDLPGSRTTTSSAVKPTTPVRSEPLSALAVANRLSYFLWSSMPDEELLKQAQSGALLQPNVLLAQTRRMLKDPRVRGFATEFTGHWLNFRHFEKSNSVDRSRFPEFTDDLREAMFQEPVRLVEDAIASNRSALDLLHGKHTFVNPVLAKFYGMPVEGKDTKHWTRVDDANKYGRGGLLPMAVFLTLNSPGLRTSPVKRGYWVVQKVLGEVIPPPPPVVPELPHDESTSERPVREMLAKHREVPLCAGCHQRFDSFGLAFEGYGPVGNARTKDLAGRPVDTAVTYPGGFQGNSIDGLRAFIHQRREKDFVANMSRKMLAFALNRSLQLSDEALIDMMQTKAAANGYRMQPLIETIVTSPQFLKKRLPETSSVAGAQKARP